MLLAWHPVQDLCHWRAAQPVSSCWIPVGPAVSSEPALPLALTLLCPHGCCLFPASLNAHPLATFTENSPEEPPERVCALTGGTVRRGQLPPWQKSARSRTSFLFRFCERSYSPWVRCFSPWLEIWQEMTTGAKTDGPSETNVDYGFKLLSATNGGRVELPAHWLQGGTSSQQRYVQYCSYGPQSWACFVFQKVFRVSLHPLDRRGTHSRASTCLPTQGDPERASLIW